MNLVRWKQGDAARVYSRCLFQHIISITQAIRGADSDELVEFNPLLIVVVLLGHKYAVNL
jgi:hypothetical protein